VPYNGAERVNGGRCSFLLFFRLPFISPSTTQFAPLFGEINSIFPAKLNWGKLKGKERLEMR